MKSPKLLNSSFLFVVFCLVGCRDKQELGFLGDIEVGKYEITQFREYPNGDKDTLVYEAYGPYTQAGANRYVFEIYRNSTYRTLWEVLEHTNSFSSENPNFLDARNYTSQVQNLTVSSFDLDYVYTTNYNGVVLDSAIGVINFKRLPQ